MLTKKTCNVSSFVIIALIAIIGKVGAQTDSERPSVKAIASAYSDSIVVRWGVDNAVAWQLTNKYGYLLERYTLMRNGERLPNPERIKLVNTPQKPLPLDQWEPLTEDNDYALIAAQAIYGETFQLSENYSTDVMQVINKSRELEQRFSFALFSADMSPVVAKASGLWFTDHSIKPNEKYVYKVYANVPANIQEIDSGYVFVGVDDYKELPKPVELEADFEDQKVMLSWNRSYYDNLYVAYKVEKSLDGKRFFPMTDLPIVNTESPTGNYSRLMFKTDSLDENYKTYYYRVKGLTAFGETGPASDTVSGFGFKELKEGPTITEANVIDNQRIQLKWVFNDEYNQNISGFKLLRAPKANGKYTLVSDNIAPPTREFVDEAPQTVNYYKLTAYDEYGQTRSSFNYLAQLIDSIPPLSPLGLIGKVDTTGVVTIAWNSNSEEDLRGYRVYRNNFKSDEVQEVTVDPIQDTVFYDSVEVKTLTKTLYYQVRAVDNHYNPSEYSDLLELQRPDVIPPTPPVFRKVRATGSGIELQWINSSSDDVENHLLYRRKSTDRGWKLLAVFNNNDTSYIDMETELKSFYEYTMLAVDTSKLESDPAIPVRSKRIDTGIRKEMNEVYASVNREQKQIRISWEYESVGVEKFEVYRAKEDESLRIYKSLSAESNHFIDEKLVVNTNYSYRLRAVYKDGGKTPLSKKIEVKY